MVNKYFGCESAASATAKIEVVNSYNDSIITKIFFGDEEEMFDYLNNNWWGDGTYRYSYIREVNWESGRLGGWQICKSNWA